MFSCQKMKECLSLHNLTNWGQPCKDVPSSGFDGQAKYTKRTIAESIKNMFFKKKKCLWWLTEGCLFSERIINFLIYRWKERERKTRERKKLKILSGFYKSVKNIKRYKYSYFYLKMVNKTRSEEFVIVFLCKMFEANWYQMVVVTINAKKIIIECGSH